MTTLFNRSASAIITMPGERVTIRDLRLQFYVRKTRSSAPNELTVRVFGVSDNTAAMAARGRANVAIRSGYAGASYLVAQGNITRATVERFPPSKSLFLECLDGISEIREGRVSLSFASGATVGDVLNTLVSENGLSLRVIETELNTPFRGGFSYVGKLGGALNELTRRIEAKWSIQNGALFIIGGGESVPGEIALITPRTGLIGSPHPIEDDINIESIGGATRSGFQLTTLLQPQLEPANNVRIESANANGVFQIDEVTHFGDTHSNEWYSTMTVF